MPPRSSTAPRSSIDWSAEPDLEELRAVRRLPQSDAAVAVRRLQVLAERGSPVSMYLLGAHFGAGKGVVKSEAEAERWFRKAARAGSVEGSYRLAMTLYRQGRFDEAASEYEKLAAIDFTPAMNKLGKMYLQGRGVGRNLNKAKALWEAASARGHLRARRSLGGLLASGQCGLGKIPEGLGLIASAVANTLRVADPHRPSDLLR